MHGVMLSHLVEEGVEQKLRVLRPSVGLGVELNRHERLLEVAAPLVGPVVRVGEQRPPSLRERVDVHSIPDRVCVCVCGGGAA